MMIGTDNHKIGFFVGTIVRCAERANMMSLAVKKAVRQLKPRAANLALKIVSPLECGYEGAVA